jgi:hypothetical protein
MTCLRLCHSCTSNLKLFQLQAALKKEKAVGALVAILVGGQAAGKEAAAVALANLAVGSKDVAVRFSGFRAHGVSCNGAVWCLLAENSVRN